MHGKKDLIEIMKIKKSRNIRFKITGVSSFAVIFSWALCYFLGWHFEVKTFLIALSILLSLLILIWSVCYILIKFEKKYYKIENERITLWQEDKLLLELKSSDIIEMYYVRFFNAFLLQMGSGYLNITCPADILEDRKFASLIIPNGIAILEISMSKNQAQITANILSKNLKIK